jgi:hypothetical protein
MSSESGNDYDAMYGSTFFSAADLHGRRMKVEVLDYEITDLRDKQTGAERRRIVLLLKDQKSGRDLKKWVVNKTNATTLSNGGKSKDPEDWIGAILELFSTPTPMGDGIRCSIIKAPAKSKAKASEEDEAGEDEAGEDADDTDDLHPIERQFRDPEYIKRRERHMRRKGHGRGTSE